MVNRLKKERYLEKKIKKIGFLDIETKTDSFKASSGYMISWVLKIVDLESNEEIDYSMILDKAQNPVLNPKMDYDKDLLPELVRTMKECDLIVTHYGTWFDIPFIRTRCQMLKIPFIKHADKIRFADTWKLARLAGSYKSNSLDFVSRTLGVTKHKTRVDYSEWAKAVWGDRKSLGYVLKHNVIDVEVTKAVWEKLEESTPVPARYY
jgi:uncharacterized protein YprB with RNaseH-like and TPR domain